MPVDAVLLQEADVHQEVLVADGMRGRERAGRGGQLLLVTDVVRGVCEKVVQYPPRFDPGVNTQGDPEEFAMLGVDSRMPQVVPPGQVGQSRQGMRPDHAGRYALAGLDLHTVRNSQVYASLWAVVSRWRNHRAR